MKEHRKEIAEKTLLPIFIGKSCLRDYFTLAARSYVLVFFIALCSLSFSQNITVKGIVFDKDSITPMQFAYVVDKNSSTGMVTDDQGKFSMKIHWGDTLSFSYVGYSLAKLFTHSLKDSVKNGVLNIKIYLRSKITELRTIAINANGFSKEAKEMYARKIDEYNRGISSPLASPISAMYYAWSKKGKELQKLSFLYDQLMVDEIKEHRLSSEKVRMITGNDSLDVRDFLNSCYISDQQILYASDYDLFLTIKNYYSRYMEMKRKNK